METYEYVDLIGEGAYGSVWRCLDKVTGQSVAIKRFKASNADEEILRLALREVRLLKLAKHPNIVKLLEAFRSKSGRVYLVLEFVERTVTADLQKYHFGLPPKLVKSITWQLLQAVNFLHKRKILHRDIKPANILMTKDNQVKLCDFGFARTMHPKETSDYSSYVVTRWYRPPEVIVGDKYGPAVDIWAIGCIFAELATGQPVFPGRSNLDQLWLILRTYGQLTPRQMQLMATNSKMAAMRMPAPNEIRSLDRKFPLFTPEMMQVVKACLQLDPANRPTAEECMRLPYFADLYQQQQQQLAQLELDSCTSATPQILSPTGPAGNPLVTADILNHNVTSAEIAPRPSTRPESQMVCTSRSVECPPLVTAAKVAQAHDAVARQDACAFKPQSLPVVGRGSFQLPTYPVPPMAPAPVSQPGVVVVDANFKQQQNLRLLPPAQCTSSYPSSAPMRRGGIHQRQGSCSILSELGAMSPAAWSAVGGVQTIASQVVSPDSQQGTPTQHQPRPLSYQRASCSSCDSVDLHIEALTSEHAATSSGGVVRHVLGEDSSGHLAYLRNRLTRKRSCAAQETIHESDTGVSDEEEEQEPPAGSRVMSGEQQRGSLDQNAGNQRRGSGPLARALDVAPRTSEQGLWVSGKSHVTTTTSQHYSSDSARASLGLSFKRFSESVMSRLGSNKPRTGDSAPTSSVTSPNSLGTLNNSAVMLTSNYEHKSSHWRTPGNSTNLAQHSQNGSTLLAQVSGHQNAACSSLAQTSGPTPRRSGCAMVRGSLQVQVEEPAQAVLHQGLAQASAELSSGSAVAVQDDGSAWGTAGVVSGQGRKSLPTIFHSKSSAELHTLNQRTGASGLVPVPARVSVGGAVSAASANALQRDSALEDAEDTAPVAAAEGKVKNKKGLANSFKSFTKKLGQVFTKPART